jgi:hypothetical protein
MDTISQTVARFIQKWKMANTATLRKKAFASAVSYEGLKSALARLRESGDLLSCRIGLETFHFHPIYRRRFNALVQRPVNQRWSRAQKWGFEHHLEVIRLGFRFEDLLPEFHVSTNLFADFASFAEGTTTGRGKKFCPDLHLSYQAGDLRRSIYVEYERTTKTKSRYLERWLAYHSDPRLRACLYIVSEPNVQNRLEPLIQHYLRSTFQRSSFRIGLLLLDRQKPPSLQTELLEFSRGSKLTKTVEDFLKSDQPPSRTRPNFQNNDFYSESNLMRGRWRLTTLPLPSSTSLEVPKGSERVVNLQRGRSEEYMEEGKGKFGRVRE